MDAVKKYLQLFLLMMLINAYIVKGQDRGEVNFQIFYSSLSPYGNWIDHSSYGRVWQPRVTRGFRPYRDRGHWVWSDMYQWIWVSDYDWGWAAFHYGRWTLDPMYGWVWVPGYDWSPAWVSWRSGPDYYGWAPLSPGINISFGFVYDQYYPPNDYWVFVPRPYMHSVYLNQHCYATHYNQGIITHTKPVRTMTFGQFIMNAPTKKEVEKSTGHKIQAVRVGDANQPGRNKLTKDRLEIYRPQIKSGDVLIKQDGQQEPKPRQIEQPKPKPQPQPQQIEQPKPKEMEQQQPKPRQIEQQPKPRQEQQEIPKPRQNEQQPKPKQEQQEIPKPRQLEQQPKPRQEQQEIPKPRQIEQQPKPRQEQQEIPKPRQIEQQPRLRQIEQQQPKPRQEKQKPQAKPKQIDK